MMVTFVSQCEKNALKKTRRVLDTFADRIGNNIRVVMPYAKSFAQEEVASESKSLVKGSVKSSVKILQLLQCNPQMSIPELSSLIGISTRAIEKNIKTLQSKGQLQRIGGAKGGHWQVPEDGDE